MSQSSLNKQVFILFSINLAVAAAGFLFSYEVGLVCLALSLSVSGLWLKYRVSKPLHFLSQQVKSVTVEAIGKRHFRFSSTPIEEISDLGVALKRLSKRLNKRFDTIEMHSNEKDAILSSMSEGVVVVHKDERVLLMNQEAQKILDVENFRGKPELQKVIRNPQLIEFIRSTLDRQLSAELELEIVESKKTFLRVTSRPLKEVTKRKGGGVVIVITDVTRVRQLEAHRREFVTNVSHELRTPLTSIQGFAETLMISDVTEEERKKFLEIIQKHSARLNDIIEDILSLSRLERPEENIELAPGSIHEVIESAVELCSVKAQKHKVQLSIRSSQEARANINGPLLEQAVVNLIDNAIKYSKENGEVEVTCTESSGEFAICVRDQGPGIPEKHFTRLFERFYRVDKARARANGGTGLGLSIVKHIAQVHNGQVGVTSKIGHGSQFHIQIPKIPELGLHSNEELTQL